MSKFEDQLFDDLIRAHGPTLAEVERPAVKRIRTSVWVAAGAVGLAGATTAGVVLFTGGTPAYAVDQHSDGSVTVSIRDMTAIDDMNRELARRRIPVVAVPMRTGCPRPPVDRLPHDTTMPKWGFGFDSDTKAGSVTVEATANTDQKLVLAVGTDEHGKVLLGVMISTHVPECLPLEPINETGTPAPTT
ncbi:hypothetical protein [Actinocrispum wychmicini]|uniref:Uncharacterized protein n=1 Tax=Actinocrispum wychmicini TaxID=1213861 RepID=A0A4R2IPV7_9PSEU|nr:hypothetical protein [Actinocrispum wychmicini]TCO46722.1 hypothetical protein EV192_118117 [Actinocrispum wychmicini]